MIARLICRAEVVLHASFAMMVLRQMTVQESMQHGCRSGIDRNEVQSDVDTVQAAAAALRAGDPGPAREVVDDDVLHRVMLVGEPSSVGTRLAELVRAHRPASIGVALLQDDPHVGVTQAAEAFAAMRRELEGD